MNLTLTTLQVDYTAAYERLYRATSEAMQAEAELAKAKAGLTLARNTILLQYIDDAKGLGPNEATREASITSKCFAETEAARYWDGVARSARNAVELAAMEVSHQKTLLRFAELAAGIARGTEAGR